MSNDTSRKRKGMWQKLKEKREIEREHESNFNAGRIDIHERNLHRTGIRGRKRYIFYAFLYILGILCFINLVMLCIMLSVLRIDKNGMESLSLFKSGLVRWMYGGDLEHVVLKTGEIGAFAGRNLSIVGRNGGVQFAHIVPGVNGSFAHFGPNQTKLQARDGVRIVSTDVNKTILHIAEREIVWDVPAKAFNLDTTYVVSHRITSDHTDNLYIKGKKNVKIRGNENVFVDSTNLTLNANTGNIMLQSEINSTITFETKKVYFPIVQEADVSKPKINVKRFQLCICKDTQKLFKVDVTTTINGCEWARTCS